MAITTRAAKGSPLTHTEMDANITAIPEKTSSTGVVKGASGTTAQRPATPIAGYTRFNTTTGRHETYSGSAWIEDVNTADTSTSGMGFVVDEDTMTSNSATKIPTQQSVKAYVDTEVAAVGVDWTVDQGATNIHAGNYTDTNTTYTVGDGGLTQINFTSADNTKLDGIATSANNYSHPTSAGDKHIPTAGASGQFLKYSSSGTAIWAADTNTTYAVGDGGLTQINFTSADNTKLDGVEASARSEEHTSELQSQAYLVCRLLLE